MGLGIRGLSQGLFTRVLGMTDEEVETLLYEVLRELGAKQVHASFNV